MAGAETQNGFTAPERLARLRLIRTARIGPITFRKLIGRYGDALAVLDALPALRITPASATEAEAELEELEALGATATFLGEPAYPARLAQIADAPPVLFTFGDLDLLTRPSVAIVGARNASAAGRKIAGDLARDLGAGGYLVVSGLARGVDGAAHEAALATGTAAVLAGGVDSIYPPQHTELYRLIADQGVILSERSIGWAPTARDFPRRNRLISGLAQGVVVVEAAARSGTLITARFALEQGRDVFAVPGSPLDPRAAGVNRLIRDGAVLVESAADIIDELSAPNRSVLRDWSASATLFDGPVDEDPPVEDLALRIKSLLSPAYVHRDEILKHVDASPGAVADALLELILKGEAEERYGGFFATPAP